MTEPVRRFPIVAGNMARDPGAVKSPVEKKNGAERPREFKSLPGKEFCFKK